jgi:hypothetical protein
MEEEKENIFDYLD